MPPPRISVVVPSYNHRRFLGRRFESIWAQTSRPREIVFMDDGSTDGSAEYVRALRSPVPIRVETRASNGGSPFRQWREGVEKCSGDYVWIAESDDTCRPDLLEKLSAVLDRDSGLGMAYAQSIVIDENDRPIDDHLRYTWDLDPDRWCGDYSASGSAEVERCLSIRNTIPNVSACLFRRSAFADVDWGSGDLKLAGDWYVYSQLLRHHGIAFVSDRLNCHRRHRHTVRERTARGWLRIEENYRVLASIHAAFPGASANRERAAREQFDAVTATLCDASRRGESPPERLLEAARNFDPRFDDRLIAYRSGAGGVDPGFYGNAAGRLARGLKRLPLVGSWAASIEARHGQRIHYWMWKRDPAVRRYFLHAKSPDRRQAKKEGGEPWVLVVSHDAALAGAQVLLVNLLTEWKRRAPFPVKIICVGDGEMRPQFEGLFPTLVLSDHRNEARRETALREFTAGPCRVVYSSTVVNGPLLGKLRALGAPIVTHSHELQKAIERWAPGKIIEDTLRHSDFFLGGCQAVAANLRDRHGVPENRLDVVYDFIEPWDRTRIPTPTERRDMQRELSIADTDIVVYGCGTTDWRKGPDLFLQIAILACAQEERLKFVWIGGDSGYGRDEVAAKGLIGRIRFVGNRALSRRYYYTGHIFALTSREDPCPLVALEASDAGLPVVCFDGAGDIPRVLGNEGGSVVPFEDVGAAAASIVALARNPAGREELGRAGRQRVLKGHSSRAAALAIEAVFDRVAPRARASSAVPGLPLVSVVVPNFNHAKFLPERLRSVAGQTLDRIEIILLDDASTDGSQGILRAFAAGDPRARLIENEKNSGSTFRQWRKGLLEARGRYVWIAESDDVADPSLLATLVARLEKDSSVALACCQLRMMDASGKIGGTPDEWLDDIDPRRWKSDYTNGGLDEIRGALSKKNTILNASGVVFRNFAGIEQLVPESLRLSGDWLFWIRLLARGGIAYTAAPLNYWRLNTSNARTRPPGELEWEEGQQVLAEAADLLHLESVGRTALLNAYRARCEAWSASGTAKK